MFEQFLQQKSWCGGQIAIMTAVHVYPLESFKIISKLPELSKVSENAPTRCLIAN